MSSSGFRLPCVHCSDSVTFDSSQQLKEHLLKNHGDLLTHASDPVSYHHHGSLSVIQDGRHGCSKPFSSIHSRKESDNDRLLCAESSSLFLQHRLRDKSPFQCSSKLTDHFSDFQPSERYTRHAEPHHGFEDLAAIRSKRSSCEMPNFPLSQNSKFDLEKDVRNDNCLNLRSVKEHIEKINLKSLNDVDKLVRSNSTGKLEETARDESQLFSTKDSLFKSQSFESSSFERVSKSQCQEEGSAAFKEIKDVKLRRPDAETVLGRIEDFTSESTSKDKELVALRTELEKEKKFNVVLRENLKGALKKNEGLKSPLKAGDDAMGKGPTSPFDLKNNDVMLLIKKVEEENQNVRKEVESMENIKNEMSGRVDELQGEKEKLVERLKEADEALSKLSTRVTTPSKAEPSTSDDGRLMESVNKQLKKNCDEISNLISQIPTKEQISSRKELVQIKDELHRVSLLLNEEKMNHANLKRSTADLEETVKGLSDYEEEKTKIYEELNALKMKHKKCAITENALKQVKREKKVLQRKYDSLKGKFEFLKIVGATRQQDDDHSEDTVHCENDPANHEEGDVSREDIGKLREELAERDAIIREYETDYTNLIERMEATYKELDKLKESNKDLESKQEISLEKLNANLKHLNICMKEPNTQSNNAELEQEMAKLLIDIGFLERRIKENEDEIESLQAKVNELEIIKLSNESEIASLQGSIETSKISQQNGDSSKTSDQYSRLIENLNLEKDILSSRVLVLEGIHEEVEILRKEKDTLKKANEELKTKVEEFRRPAAKSSFSDGDVNVNGRFSNVKGNKVIGKNLYDLNDSDKDLIHSLLLDPSFNPSESMEFDFPIPFESTKNVSLPKPSFYERSSSTDLMTKISNNSLSRVDSTTTEFVQNIHLPSDHHQNVEEVTFNYLQRTPPSTIDPGTIDSGTRGDVVTKETFTEKALITEADGEVAEVIKPSSKKKKFLGRLKKGRKTKKVKRKDSPIIAIVPQTERVVNSGGDFTAKVELKSSPILNKQVKFSDQLLEVSEETEHSGTSDADLSKSYYKEALKSEFPSLADSEENTEEIFGSESNGSPNSVRSGNDSPFEAAMKSLRHNFKEWSADDKRVDWMKGDQGYESTASSYKASSMASTATAPESSSNMHEDSRSDKQSPDARTTGGTKEFDDLVLKYREARMEFTEKKRNASDALKMLKSLMSKADKLHTDKGFENGAKDSDLQIKKELGKMRHERGPVTSTPVHAVMSPSQF